MRVTRIPRPAGSGQDTEKARFRQIYLLRGFWESGHHQTLTLGVVQLLDAMHPGGAKVNISWGFWVKGPLFRLFEAFGA